MDENIDYIAAQRDTDADFSIFIFNLISKVTFEMIISRAYLNNNLKKIHTKAMDELLFPGYISQREYDDDHSLLDKYLSERISSSEREWINKRNKKL